MNKILFSMILMVIGSNAFSASLVTCSDLYVKQVWIEADREDEGTPPLYSNKVFIQLANSSGTAVTCNGLTYVYLGNNKPAYNSVMSAALTAMTANKKVTVYVNPTYTIGSTATELAIIMVTN